MDEKEILERLKETRYLPSISLGKSTESIAQEREARIKALEDYLRMDEIENEIQRPIDIDPDLQETLGLSPIPYQKPLEETRQKRLFNERERLLLDQPQSEENQYQYLKGLLDLKSR